MHRVTACTTAGPPIRRKSSLHHRQATGNHRKTACTTAEPPIRRENSLNHRGATRKDATADETHFGTTAFKDAAFRSLCSKVTESGPSARLELQGVRFAINKRECRGRSARGA